MSLIVSFPFKLLERMTCFEKLSNNQGTLTILEILVVKREAPRFQGLAILRPYLADGSALYRNCYTIEFVCNLW